MLRGLLTLTWLEIKIFVREPLGVIGTVGIPVLIFIVLGRMFAPRVGRPSAGPPDLISVDHPILAAILIALSAVLSLVTIIAIYREGGILKRLRATPLRSITILTAHVLVKLLFTAVTLAGMILAGKRYFPTGVDAPFVSFGIGLLYCTFCIVSMGFLIASVVPTARFAQPLGTLILYPMVAISGLFAPITALPPAMQFVARLLPLTYTVSLLRGIWRGDGWIAHAGDVAALGLIFLICTGVSARVFRWQ